MRAPPCQRKVPPSPPKQCASQAVNPYPLSTVTHAPRPLTPPTHRLPVGKGRTFGSSSRKRRGPATPLVHSRRWEAGQCVSPSFPRTPPTPPPPPTTSKPREMQRPGFLGCPERLSEQGLARWSGLGWLSLPGCGVASASSSFLPDRRCRAASGDNGCWKQCYKLFDYTVNISLLLLLAVISFLQRRKLLSYSVPRLQRVQRGCIALSLSRGSVFNASFLYLHNGFPLLVVTPPRPQLCLSGQSVNCVFLASKFSCLCSKRWAQISISS